jgi:hypothetical protein
LDLSNTIIANSTNYDCYSNEAIIGIDVGNLIEVNGPPGYACGNPDIEADPKLMGLGLYGGPTETHALDSRSPAIDNGNEKTCQETDQRGMARPQGSACDIGAFEYRSGNTAPTFTSKAKLTATAGVIYTYEITAEDKDMDSLTISADLIPDWLSLRDHGDGTATLSGTPGIADIGVHDVVLRVADFLYAYDTQEFDITVSEAPEEVVADFFATPTSGEAPLLVTFMNQSTGDFINCEWDFGDGGTSTTCATPQHTYSAPGTYTVSLTVSGSGGTDEEIKTDYITVLPGEGFYIFLPLILR